MEKTYHAEMRMQQRGVTDHVLEIVLTNGHQDEAPGGGIRIFFGKKEYTREMSRLKEYQKLLERAKNRVVILKDERMLTTYKNQSPNIFV